MFAIVEIGGKQYKVQEKSRLVVERVATEEGETFGDVNVLLVSDGEKTKIGTPYVEGAKLELKVVKHDLAPKVRIYKMSAKKRTRKMKGHRQPQSEVEVVSLSA